MEVNRQERLLDANDIGYALAEEYFAVFNEMPERTLSFYAEQGDYHTVYEDGTTIVAKNREELQQTLLRPVPENTDAIIIEAVNTISCGSPNCLLVLATGERIVQTFVVESYSRREQQYYTIISSVTKYLSAKTVSGRSPVETTADRPSRMTIQNRFSSFQDDISAADVSPVKSTVNLSRTILQNHKSHIDDTTANGFPTKPANKRDCFANEIAADPQTVKRTTDLPPAETIKLKSILKKRMSYIDITANRSLPKTAKKSVRFANDIVTYELPVKSSENYCPPNTAVSSKLFIGNLPKTTMPQELADMLGQFGRLKNLRIKEGVNRYGKPARYNYALVEFDSPSAAKNALSRRPLKLYNNILYVDRQYGSGDFSRH